MSTIKVNKIENTSTTAGGVAIDSSGHVQVDGVQMPTAGPLSNRNLIINGAMQVAQRGTSTTGVTSGGIYTTDRWKLDTTDEATYTIEQSPDSPVGFDNSLKFTVTTADSSIAADDYSACHYLIEGLDCVPLGFGAADAKSFTLSFWVKSSETGTFGLNFQNADNSKNFNSSYSISTADTWEYKTITIPGDTSGTWLKNNAVGLKLWFSFLVGTTYEASAVSTNWDTSVKLGLNGQVQLSSITNATWQITGVQLEVGEKSTEFEHRSYGDELARCMRYYRKVKAGLHGYWNTSSNCRIMVTHYGMRIGPAYRVTDVLTITDFSSNPVQSPTGNVTDNGSTPNGAQLNCANFTGAVAGRPAHVLASSAGAFELDSEL